MIANYQRCCRHCLRSVPAPMMMTRDDLCEYCAQIAGSVITIGAPMTYGSNTIVIVPAPVAHGSNVDLAPPPRRLTRNERRVMRNRRRGS